MRVLLAGCFILCSGLAQAECAVSVNAGATFPTPMIIPSRFLATDLCIDVPAGVEKLTVSLVPADPAIDVDMLLRVNSPFPDSGLDAPSSVSTDYLLERAHYVSLSRNSSESIVISRSSAFPLSAGTIYLELINFSDQSAQVELSSAIGSLDDFVPINAVFDSSLPASTCDLSGWNDPSPRTPVRGNSGTTLGEQRRNAMREATRLLGEQLRPAAMIDVLGCWRGIASGNGRTVLSQSGNVLALLEPSRGGGLKGLQHPYTVYSLPAAVHQAGSRSCQLYSGDCSAPGFDAQVVFNAFVDQALSEADRFDYGIQPAASPSTQPSFVTAALHELVHAMGVRPYVNLDAANGPVGSKRMLFGLPYDDAFGNLLRIVDPTTSDSGVNQEFLRVEDEERVAALGSPGSIRFAGPTASASLLNIFRNNLEPFNQVQLDGPSLPNAIRPGVPYTHLSPQYTSELMTNEGAFSNSRSLGLALDILRDIGFGNSPQSAPAYVMPPDGQYFDVTRNGHGIDFRRVAGTEDLYFLGLYSHDSEGNPEWFTSLGRIVDGVFFPAPNVFEDSLLRFTYTPGVNGMPGVSAVDSSDDFFGRIRINSTDSERHPSCQASAGQSSSDQQRYVMGWTLTDQLDPDATVSGQWCMQLLAGPPSGVDVDFSSVWFDPSDPGWGLAVQTIPGDGGDGISIGVYYPDAEGKGRWGIAQTSRYLPNQPITVRQVQGYCRGPECPTPGALSFVDIGTLTIDLREPGEGQSTLSLDVTYPGAAGGRFQRNSSPISPANSPNYRNQP